MSTHTDAATPARDFLEESARLLDDQYLPKLRRAVDALPADELWWRPNDASNSVGNLLLHMAGNLRQWVVSGVGNTPDERRRDEEFAARDAPEPLHALEAAVAEATTLLRGLDPADLGRRITVQGREVSVLEAVYHAVEHFSMHAGQVLWITKARTGEGLGLYSTGPDGHPRRAW
jgi:uncharacterized damage-inducible protein DinB